MQMSPDLFLLKGNIWSLKTAGGTHGEQPAKYSRDGG